MKNENKCGKILVMEDALVAYAHKTPLTEADFKAVNDQITACFPHRTSPPQQSVRKIFARALRRPYNKNLILLLLTLILSISPSLY